MLKDEVKLDADWIQLLKEARNMGLSKEVVRGFLQKDKSVNSEPLKK